jgi:hypothetical protein
MPSIRSRCAQAAVLVPILVCASTRTVAAQAPSTFDEAWRTGTPVTVTGLLSVLQADDFANRRSELIHLLRDERTGRSFRLRFDKKTLSIGASNTRITISGRRRDSDIYMLADQVSGVATGSTTPQTSTTTTSGDQRTLVVVANFRDKNLDCLTSDVVADLNGIMWNGTGTWPDPSYNYSVDALYREASSGQVSFSGTVVGPYTIDYSAVDPCCDLNGWADAANAAAAADGVDLSAYPRKLYAMPGNAFAGFSGIADLGKTPSAAFVFESCQMPDVFAHELGHNLGFYHASTLTDEYGDHSDFMGGAMGYLRQVDAPHKAQAGWLPLSQVVTVTEDGVYNVAPLESDATTVAEPQALRIFKPDTGEYYYLSYRQAIGFDRVLVCCPYLDRLSVHRWSGAKTMLVATLADGETFADPTTGFTVTQVSHSSTSSTASVRLGSGCGSAAPSLSLTPQNQSGKAGTSVNYDIALINNDAAGCAPASFSLSGVIPAGWVGSFSQANLQLAAGSTGHATLTTTSALNASPGTYNEAIEVSDVNVPAHVASVSGSYTVVPACMSAPAVSISPASQTGSAGATLTYSVTVTNRDGAGCSVTTFMLTPAIPSSWGGSISSSSLNLVPGASGIATYSVTSATGATASTYGVAINVGDGVNAVHNAVANASYIVQPGDTTPPTAPSNLTAKLQRGQVRLSWTASSDNVSVAGYLVSRDGVAVGTTNGIGWTDQSAVAGSTYNYSVVAYDASGNLSRASNSVTVKITAGGKGK